MLKTTALSSAKKTGGIAVTYRSGSKNKFDTCPKNCELNPSGCGSNEIDQEYLDAVLKAKPRRGESFLYTHFSPLFWRHKMSPKTSTINWSAKTIKQAINATKNNIPSVTVVSESFFKNGKNKTIDGTRIVRCIAEYNDITCLNCGNGKPLCARQDRDYVIGFTAHGAGKKKASDPNEKGGCYANGGNVNLHWQKMPDQSQNESDAEKLLNFVKKLSPFAILRHHIAGDLGRD